MPVRTTLRWFSAGALAVAMGMPATAAAATLSVDDDGLDCPSAAYSSVQAAVDAASPGDIVAICPGTYEEGPATVPNAGANAVSIAKMITVRGAGASKVTIRPRPAIASLLGTTTTYRNTTGAVIGVYRSGVRQLVDISGVTVEGGNTTVGSAVKFYNAEGSLTGSVIRNVAPLTGPQGYGVVIASNLVADRIPVRVAGTAISGYAKAGVVIDSTQAAPALGILAATVTQNRITGAGTQAQTGQQGVFATGLATGAITSNIISANLGLGDAASAGVRLVDLDLTPTTVGGTTTKLTATGNDITGNGYGVRNETGTGADQTVAFTATGNWWGHVAGPSIGLPKTVGDPVNGAAVNYSGFRTTPITAPTTPSAVTDGIPTGSIDSPGSVQPGRSTTLRAFAADDFGVKSVTFAIDGTIIGTDTKVPYATAWTPGPEFEGRAAKLSVVVTDSSGQTTAEPLELDVLVKTPKPEPTATPEPTPTATPEPTPTVVSAATATPTPTSVVVGAGVTPRRPSAVTLKARSSNGRKLTLSGNVQVAAGACPVGATVRISVSLPGGLIKRTTATLTSTCRYSAKISFPRLAGGRIAIVRARLEASGATLARSAPQRVLRIKR